MALINSIKTFIVIFTCIQFILPEEIDEINYNIINETELLLYNNDQEFAHLSIDENNLTILNSDYNFYHNKNFVNFKEKACIARVLYNNNQADSELNKSSSLLSKQLNENSINNDEENNNNNQQISYNNENLDEPLPTRQKENISAQSSLGADSNEFINEVSVSKLNSIKNYSKTSISSNKNSIIKAKNTNKSNTDSDQSKIEQTEIIHGLHIPDIIKDLLNKAMNLVLSKIYLYSLIFFVL